MRPAARRPARAATAGIIVAALVTALLPALPALARGPVKVTGQDIETPHLVCGLVPWLPSCGVRHEDFEVCGSSNCWS